MLTCDVCKGTGKDIADVIRELEEKFGAVITCVPGGDYANDPEALAIPTLPYKPIEPPKQIELIETIKSIEQPVEPKPIEEPKQPKLISQPVETIPTIEMHSGDGCGPCKAWIATEMPKWQKAGWTVKVIKETTTSVGWPWFDITDRDGLRFSVYGPLTTDTFIAAKRPLLRLQLPRIPTQDQSNDGNIGKGPREGLWDASSPHLSLPSQCPLAYSDSDCFSSLLASDRVINLWWVTDVCNHVPGIRTQNLQA